MQATAILGAHLGAAAAPLVRRALPLGAAAAIVGGVFFGPDGVTAADVLSAAEAPAGRAALWLAWLLPTQSLAATALDPPGVRWLATLPVPRAWLAGAAIATLAIVELPLALFAFQGDGAAAAACFGLLAAAAHAQGFAGLRGRTDALVAVVIAALAFAPANGLVAIAALPVAVLTATRAWRGAAERGRAHGRARLGGPAAIALAHAHLLAVLRTEAATLGRAAVVVVLAGALAGLAGGNARLAGLDAWAPLALGIGGAAFAVALAGPVGAVLRAESRDAGWLDAAGLGPGARVTAAALAAAALGAACGIVYAAALLATTAAPHAVAALGAAGGALVAVGLAGALRHAQARASRVTHRATIAVLAVGAATATSAAAGGLHALGSWAVLAAVVLVATLPLAAGPRDPEDPWGRRR